jgi:hypothetical protein
MLSAPNDYIETKDNDKIKNFINETEIGLILDTYDDIFSDFDPRPYNQRSISEDLLIAAKRAARDKGTGLELRFLVPKTVRNLPQEELIKQRLKDHFRKHYKAIKTEDKNRRKQAIFLIVIGIVIGLIDALTLSTPATFNLSAIFTDAIGLILTPASWYSIWAGFDRLLIKSKEDVAEEEFYKKMRDVQITFSDY